MTGSKLLVVRQWLKLAVVFIGKSFWTRDEWQLFAEDEETFGRNLAPFIAWFRAEFQLNSVVTPLTLLTHDKYRIVTFFADVLALPLLALLCSYISRYLPEKEVRFYQKVKTQDRTSLAALAFTAADTILNLMKGDFTRGHAKQIDALAHNVLYPLFIKRYVIMALPAFDKKIPMPWYLRTATITVVLFLVTILAYGYYEYFVLGKIS